MKAFIKKEKWEEFKKDYVKYGFSFAVFPDKFYTKLIDRFLAILISRKTSLVTRSKAKSKGPNLITKGIRTFEVYNAYGGSVIVEYQNENEVLYTTHEDLIKQYFEERNINIYGK